MRQWVTRHDTATFVALTFGLSWPLWLLSGTLTRTPVRAPDLRWLVAQVGVFAPCFAGMIVAVCLEPGAARRARQTLVAVYAPAVALGWWIATRGYASFIDTNPRDTVAIIALAIWILVWFGRDRNRLIPWPARIAGHTTVALWAIAAAIAPAALFAVTWALAGGHGTAHAATPAMPVRELTPAGIASAFALNLAYGGSLGEEPGWRGAWLPRLLARRTPIVASVIISAWWASWHAPIDLAQGFGASGLGALLVRQVWTLPVTVLFTWVTIRAGGSLLAPLALHTSINALGDFALGDPARYERALALFFVFTAIGAVVAAFTDRRLQRPVAVDSGTAGVSPRISPP